MSIEEDLKELEAKIQKYSDLLSIKDQKVVLKKDNSRYYLAELNWDDKQQLWTILYQDNVHEYYFVHELGHIYLSKVTKFPGFSKPIKDIYEKKVDFNLKAIFNNLLDAFVDYQLSLFKELYPILRDKYLEYIINLEDNEERVSESNSYIEVLSWYILWIHSFNYFLKKIDKNRNREKILHFLSFVKEYLVYIKQQSNIGLKESDLRIMESKTKQFENVKNTTNSIQSINYTIDVLSSTKLWEKSHILNQIFYFYLD